MRSNGKHSPHANGNGRGGLSPFSPQARPGSVRPSISRSLSNGETATAKKGTVPLPDRYTLITGGAGFIGSNLANRLMRYGRRVMVFDNLSRRGVEQNLHWLQETHGDRLKVRIGDIRNPRLVREAVRRAEQVFHF